MLRGGAEHKAVSMTRLSDTNALPLRLPTVAELVAEQAKQDIVGRCVFGV